MKEEWKTAIKLVTQAFLPRMSFHHNKSQQILYGPHRLPVGGIGLTHGYARQGADGILHLLTHLRWKSNLGKVGYVFSHSCSYSQDGQHAS